MSRRLFESSLTAKIVGELLKESVTKNESECTLTEGSIVLPMTSDADELNKQFSDRGLRFKKVGEDSSDTTTPYRVKVIGKEQDIKDWIKSDYDTTNGYEPYAKDFRIDESEEFVNHLDDIADFIIDFDPYDYNDNYSGDEEEKHGQLVRDITSDGGLGAQAYLTDIVNEELGTEEQQERAKELLDTAFPKERVAESDSLADIDSAVADYKSELRTKSEQNQKEKDAGKYANDFEYKYDKDLARKICKKYNIKDENILRKAITGKGLYEEAPTADDIKNDEKAVNQAKIKSIEDRIGELQVSIQDGSISDDEKTAVNKEIADLQNQENELKQTMNESNLNESSGLTSLDKIKELRDYIDAFITAAEERNLTEVKLHYSHSSGDCLSVAGYNGGYLPLNDDIEYDTDEFIKEFIPDSIDESVEDKKEKLNEQDFVAIYWRGNPQLANGGYYKIKKASGKSVDTVTRTLSNAKSSYGTIKLLKVIPISEYKGPEIGDYGYTINSKDELSEKLGDVLDESVEVATGDGSTVSTDNAASVQSNDGTVTVNTDSTTVVINSSKPVTSEVVDAEPVQTDVPEVEHNDEPAEENNDKVSEEPKDAQEDEQNEVTEDAEPDNDADDNISMEAKSLSVVKNQGNVYMLQVKDKEGKESYWVCEDFNSESNDASNAEQYDNKEDADKDYFERVGVTPTEVK